MRNPFYYAVDTAGQQLPYIDRIVSQTVNGETYKLKVIAGEADYAGAMTIGDFPLLKQNEDTGNYTVKLVPHVNGGDVTYTFVLDNLDPVRREWFDSGDFRRAMSLAKHDSIAAARRSTRPRVSLDPGGVSAPGDPERRRELEPRYKSEWAARITLTTATLPMKPTACSTPWGWRQAQPRRPSADVQRRADEPHAYLRRRRRGRERAGDPDPRAVKEDWAAVGVVIRLNPLDSDLIRQVETEGTMDVRATRTSGMEMYDFLSGNGGMLGVDHRGAGRFYTYWGAERNNVPEADRVGEPAPEDLAMLYQCGPGSTQSTLFGSQEYRDVRTAIFDLHAEKLWTIGVVGMVPFPRSAQQPGQRAARAAAVGGSVADHELLRQHGFFKN